MAAMPMPAALTSVMSDLCMCSHSLDHSGPNADLAERGAANLSNSSPPSSGNRTTNLRPKDY
jgi:hypothetical protein